MTVDGLSDAEIDNYLGENDDNGNSISLTPPIAVNPAQVPPPPPPPPRAPTSNDPRYAKFDKMRSMLPEGAVRQKMMLEGFTDVEIDHYFT